MKKIALLFLCFFFSVPAHALKFESVASTQDEYDFLFFNASTDSLGNVLFTDSESLFLKDALGNIRTVAQAGSAPPGQASGIIEFIGNVRITSSGTVAFQSPKPGGTLDSGSIFVGQIQQDGTVLFSKKVDVPDGEGLLDHFGYSLSENGTVVFNTVTPGAPDFSRIYKDGILFVKNEPQSDVAGFSSLGGAGTSQEGDVLFFGVPNQTQEGVELKTGLFNSTDSTSPVVPDLYSLFPHFSANSLGKIALIGSKPGPINGVYIADVNSGTATNVNPNVLPDQDGIADFKGNTLVYHECPQPFSSCKIIRIANVEAPMPVEIAGPGSCIAGANVVNARVSPGALKSDGFPLIYAELDSGVQGIFSAVDEVPGQSIVTAEVSGPNSVIADNEMELDGSGSTDSNNNAFSYKWELISKPSGASDFVDDFKKKLKYIPTKPGSYVARLTVKNCSGSINSKEFPFEVQPGENHPPVPTAQSITVRPGQSGTTQVFPNDPDQGQVHTYSVSIPPQNGNAVVSSTGLVTYTPFENFEGEDTVTILVQDNGDPVLSGTVVISISVVSPDAPTIVIEINKTNASAGDQIRVDGSKSEDPGGKKLTFKWTLTTPEGSRTTLTSKSFPTSDFRVDVPGEYIVQLTVSNGEKSASKEKSVNVKGDILVEIPQSDNLMADFGGDQCGFSTDPRYQIKRVGCALSSIANVMSSFDIGVNTRDVNNGLKKTPGMFDGPNIKSIETAVIELHFQKMKQLRDQCSINDSMCKLKYSKYLKATRVMTTDTSIVRSLLFNKQKLMLLVPRFGAENGADCNYEACRKDLANHHYITPWGLRDVNGRLEILVHDPGRWQVESLESGDGTGNGYDRQHNPHNGEIKGYILFEEVQYFPPFSSKRMANDGSTLTVLTQSGVEILLESPSGLRAGIVPGEVNEIREISGAVYFLDSQIDRKINPKYLPSRTLRLQESPELGIYKIKIHSAVGGCYPVQIMGTSSIGSLNYLSLRGICLNPGVPEEILFDFSSTDRIESNLSTVTGAISENVVTLEGVTAGGAFFNANGGEIGIALNGGEFLTSIQSTQFIRNGDRIEYYGPQGLGIKKVFLYDDGRFEVEIDRDQAPVADQAISAIRFDLIRNGRTFFTGQLPMTPRPNNGFMSLSSKKESYVVGEQAVVLMRVLAEPSIGDQEFVYEAAFNGKRQKINKSEDKLFSIVSPRLELGNSEIFVRVFQRKKSRGHELDQLEVKLKRDIERINRDLKRVDSEDKTRLISLKARLIERLEIVQNELLDMLMPIGDPASIAVRAE